MSQTMIDTLKYSKILVAGGVPKNQAEAQAEALVAVVDDHLATKSDIKDLRQEFKSDMFALKNEMLAMKNDLLIRLSGIIGLATAIISILVSIFH